jgi:hypothetical protein
MKTIFLTLAAFSLVLIIGCQENTINEPANVLMKDSETLYSSNMIKVNYDLKDPISGISTISGRVTYSLQLVDEGMGPRASRQFIVQINMDSKLEDKFGMMHMEWRVEGRSEDVLYVSEDGILLLQKSYPITNRTDVVVLVTYLVTTDGIGISSLVLAPLEK